MALPIKANDTQEGCNPIASNCVIWQGPDIPCIKLCKGDTISDVTAKLAERLCTILEYLDVSAYDLSCFNPICPSPRDFQELIQLLVDRICALNNIPVTPGGGVGCPDCVVPVAQCLQRPDALGNITASLQLRDYVILIGNEICNLTVSISSIDSRVTSLESAVTDIQTNCCAGGGGGSNLTMPASACIGTVAGTPVIDYLVALDAAFCNLRTVSGSQNDVNTALSYKCITGTDSTPSGTPSTYAQIPGWIESPTNIAQSVQDLWLIVCNQNQAIINQNQAIIDLQTQLNECCEGSGPPTPNCTEIQWSLSKGSMINGTPYWGIMPTFTGSIPAGWVYASGTGATVVITDNGGNSFTATYDLINWINDASAISSNGFVLGVGPSGVSYSSTHYLVTITLNLSNGTTTCTSTSSLLVTNTLWCQNVLASASYFTNNTAAESAYPRIAIGVTGPLFSGSNNDIPTNYTVTIVPQVANPTCNAFNDFPALIGQYVNWQGPIGTINTGAVLPASPWIYGAPTPTGQAWNYQVSQTCLIGASGTIVIQQGDYPSITCNFPLEEK
jgi:hypothetical protein